MAEGVTHISLPTQEYDRGRQEKTNRRTNTNKAWGLPRAEKRYCNTTCICGLSLAWVTSENSTMLLESDILRLFFTGPYLVSSPLCSVSGVDCPSILPRQLLFCCLPHCSPATNSFLSCPTTNCLSLSNYQLCLLGRVVNSHSPPRTTSGYGEISCPRIPLSGFAPKQTIESSALAAYPHSATTAARVQILDETDCISHSTNTPWGRYEYNYSPSSYG